METISDMVASLPEPIAVEVQPRKRVVIVEDHPIFRAGIRALLEPEFEIVGEFDGPAEALDRTVRSLPDVVILDIALPREDGISLARRIARLAPGTKLLFVSASNDQQTILDAISAGAQGYVSKTDLPEMLASAVRTVASGYAFLPPGITSKVLQSIAQRPREAALAHDTQDLTLRETVILRGLAPGRTVLELAQEEGVSPHTIANQLTGIYRKLGVSNRREALHKAAQLGLLED